MSVGESAAAQSDTQPAKKTISLEDCKAHNKEEDCWLVISDKVYDVTEFLDEHPGGFDIVLAATGKASVLMSDLRYLGMSIVGCTDASVTHRAYVVIRQGRHRGL